MSSRVPAPARKPLTTGASVPPPPAAATAPAPAATDALPANETDNIIEELKALAQSMLEATTAARSRAQAPEKKRSYEALMSAIEGRGLRIPAGPRSAADTDSEPSSSFEDVVAATSRVKENHRDPQAGLGSRDAKLPVTSHDAAAEGVTDIPAALTSQHRPALSGSRSDKDNAPLQAAAASSSSAAGAGSSQMPTTVAGGARARNEVNHGGAANGDTAEETGTTEAPTTTTVVHARKDSQPRDGREPSTETGGDGGDGEDDNVYDGVRTQVLFKSTDPRAYREVLASAWKPERLVRAADGTSEVDQNEDEDDDDEDGVQDRDGAQDGEIDDEDVVVSVQRRPPPAPSRTKVLRVPSFPFGGGVTHEQYTALRTMFSKSIRSGEAAAGGASATPREPVFVTKDAFDANAYAEVKADVLGREASFRPTSPYEFVVEVEREVVFDAVRAREQRRKEFRRLAKEGRAPVTMGTFDLRIVMDPFKTGFEDEKNFPIVKGALVADRYQIIQLLGKATFSRAVRCYDLHQPIYDDEEDGDAGTEATASPGDRQPVGYVEVCLKIINNTKDFFDQSLDEIRLLQLINKYKDPDAAHVVRLIDAFYYKEHTMLVTELLSDNLYEFAKYNREEEEEFYFTLPRLRRIARQVTEALAYVHSLNLIHTDLKPENILFLSHRRCIVKVIDFGSSCFLSDHLSSYIQSRSYRAPEVILGADYDGRIDVWSLGAILVELVTGDVLFTCETVPEMLARMVNVCGLPFPRKLLWEGRHTNSFINKFGAIYESAQSNPHTQGRHESSSANDDEPYYLYTPVPPSPNAKPYAVLKEKLAAAGMTDPLFFSFVKDCLCLDHKARLTSEQLLSHPFIVNEKV